MAKDDRKHNRTIRITDADYAMYQKIGDGNASFGMRVVAGYIKQDFVKDPTATKQRLTAWASWGDK